MLKLREAKEAYEVLAGKASEICRQLGLAAIAVVWLFKEGKDAAPSLPQATLPVLFWIGLCLALDFLQYMVGTITWSGFFANQEKKGRKLDDDVYPSTNINLPAWVLFYGKAVCLTIA
jgi:hypothetical protein